MDLDAPTPKRGRIQNNGPFRYEKMIPGRDESQVASMQLDPAQLVFCRENLYRQNAVFRVGKRYFTHTWNEAMQYMSEIPTGQRDYYEWVRAGTNCFAFLDIDAYSDTNQARWADPEWIDAARREWHSKIATALVDGFATLDIDVTTTDLQIGWGSRIDGDRYKHSYHVCVRNAETVVSDIRRLGPTLQRMWDAAGLDGTVFDKSVYSDGQQWKMCFGSKFKWEKEDGIYTGRKIHTSPMLPLDENGDVLSHEFNADIWKRHSIQGGGDALVPGKLDELIETPAPKTRRIASKSAKPAKPAQRREATDGKIDLPYVQTPTRHAYIHASLCPLSTREPTGAHASLCPLSTRGRRRRPSAPWPLPTGLRRVRSTGSARQTTG